jgi:hypothetical protein
MKTPEELLHGYLDQTLTSAELGRLQAWLAESPEHMRQLTRLLLLHNHLRSESLSFSAAGGLSSSATPLPQVGPVDRSEHQQRTRRRVLRRFFGLVASLLLVLVLFDFLRPFGRQTTATAASAELSRLINRNQSAVGRTYQIEVEGVALAGRRHGRRSAAEKRPPKPPMDDAVLHLRQGGWFVLVRRQLDGQDFVTGCDGTHSWAVRPGSPVRISSDLQRFSRDLPGHEYALSLVELTATLQQLQQSCEVQIVEGGAAADATPQEAATIAAERLLIAVRRPGFPGPRRIEIAYNAASHEIHQLRFIDMPYGPERLTLLLTLTSRELLPDSFFDHSAHHAPEVPVEQE